MKKLTHRLWPVVRIVLSVVLLWLAARNIDWATLARNELAIQPGWFLLAFLTLLCANALAASRWGWIMRGIGLHRPWLNTFGLYLSGGLINQGLPSTIGGDSYRAIEASRQAANDAVQVPNLSDELHTPIDLNKAPPRLRLSFVTVLLDRVLGLIGNIILGAAGLIIGGKVVGPWASSVGWMLMAATAGGALISVGLLGLSPARRAVIGLLERIGMHGALGGLDTTLGWPRIVPQLALATLIHVLTVAALGFCLRGFGPWVPFDALMIGLPALSILLILPISISGWGLRETTLSAVLALWGIPSGITVLASISFGLLGLLIYLPGAIFLFRRSKGGKHARRH